MRTAVVDRPMAKKTTTAKPSTSVKIHDEVLDLARVVAAYKKTVTITDLLSDILRPALEKMQTEEAAKFAKKSGGK